MLKRTRKSFVIISIAILVILHCTLIAKSATSEVEKLLAVAPDNMLGFVASSGADELKPAFEKTILGQIWNDPGVQTFYQSIKQELIKKIKQEMPDPNTSRGIEAVESFYKLVLKRPIIVGVVRKDIKLGKGPVYGFAILEAGPRKAEIKSTIDKLESFAGSGEIIDVKVGSYTMHGPKDDEGVPGYWGWVGNYFVIAINDGDGLAIKHLTGEQGRLVPTYLSKVSGAGDALSMYVNYAEMIDIFEVIAKTEGGKEDLNLVKRVIKELGLDGIGALAGRTGFSGSDIVVNEFIEIGEPRRGLFANLRPIDLSMLDMVDSRAMNASALNCNIAGMYDAVMNAVRVASPNEAYPEIQEVISEFESESKFSIRKGLLESLSGEMVYYSLPAGIMMELPSGGVVLIAKLKDASLFEKNITALGEFASAKSNGMLQVSTQVLDGKTVQTWSTMPLAMMMMQIMPTLTIVDDHVVVATNIPLRKLAAAQMEAKTNSIRNTSGYKKVTSKLPNNLISLRYTDSKVQFNQMMIGAQQYWPMITMGATNAGVKLPFTLPLLSHISDKMEPSCGYSWFDSKGLYFHYQGTGIEQSLGSIAGVSLAAGIMMPALAKVRSLSQVVISGTNLSGIGKALLVYSNDHGDKYPANLEVLIEEADLLPELLESPRKPKEFKGASYIYITGQSPLSSPMNIIAYENPAFCGDKINVLFNDIHVQAMTPEEFLKEIEATYKRLGREMPEIKF